MIAAARPQNLGENGKAASEKCQRLELTRTPELMHRQGALPAVGPT